MCSWTSISVMTTIGSSPPKAAGSSDLPSDGRRTTRMDARRSGVPSPFSPSDPPVVRFDMDETLLEGWHTPLPLQSLSSMNTITHIGRIQEYHIDSVTSSDYCASRCKILCALLSYLCPQGSR